jgi:uncharacterized membrane protein (DUF2068 family)
VRSAAPGAEASKKSGAIPAFYLIVGFKILKGSILLLLALGVYRLSTEGSLSEGYRRLVELLHLDPESQLFSGLGERIGAMAPNTVSWVARGAGVYSLFSLVEGAGLFFRVSWAGWVAIGESAFFVPIEVYEIVASGFSWALGGILLVNILIVWFLLRNRHRLFHSAP